MLNTSIFNNSKETVIVHTDSDLSRKAKKTCEKITENLYVAANEPTLACFRIQEHIHKSTPVLVHKTIEMSKNKNTLNGLLYDMEYSTSTIKSMSQVDRRFELIKLKLKDCIFLKQQIDYNLNVKRRVQEKFIQQQQKQRQITLENLENSVSFEKSRTFSSSSEQSTPPPQPTPTPPVSEVKPRARPKSSKSFNRFSTSFDFSSPSSSLFSASVVASSVSADLKSLINQFAGNNLSKNNQKVPNSSGPKIVASSSLQTLNENQTIDSKLTTDSKLIIDSKLTTDSKLSTDSKLTTDESKCDNAEKEDNTKTNS